MKKFSLVARWSALAALGTLLMAGCRAEPEAVGATPAQNEQKLLNDNSLPAPAREPAARMTQQKSRMDAMRARDAAKAAR